ncbi:hypothetical protein GUJ93_ZPchr0006g45940 [Zizania palustris]|uniref:Uncharacterized protein n=1 Tax=Zizania palustris TaxID=103762 RepID=A0A8J5SX55_ZIZPA|nr:hypothetical protein GUJ93_ZPchr0006g45940 [Zizania palustris]
MSAGTLLSADPSEAGTSKWLDVARSPRQDRLVRRLVVFLLRLLTAHQPVDAEGGRLDHLRSWSDHDRTNVLVLGGFGRAVLERVPREG